MTDDKWCLEYGNRKTDPPFQESTCPTQYIIFLPMQDSDLDNSSLETNNKNSISL